MNQNKFPLNWDEKRVQKVITHYEKQTADEATAEDEVAFEDSSQTVIQIPQELIPVVRELIAKHSGNKTIQPS